MPCQAQAPSRQELSPLGADVPAAGQGQALSHPSIVSPAAGTISHPGHQPVANFLSLGSRIQVSQTNLGRANKAVPGLSPPAAPGEPPLLLPATVPCALCTALPELPAGFSLIRAGLSPSIGPDDRTLAAFQCFGLPGFLLPSRMALLGPQLLQPAAPPAFAASTGDL